MQTNDRKLISLSLEGNMPHQPKCIFCVQLLLHWTNNSKIFHSAPWFYISPADFWYIEWLLCVTSKILNYFRNIYFAVFWLKSPDILLLLDISTIFVKHIHPNHTEITNRHHTISFHVLVLWKVRAASNRWCDSAISHGISIGNHLCYRAFHNYYRNIFQHEINDEIYEGGHNTLQ